MNVIDWLLDSDPAIRWQVMRDLTDEPAEVVADERARVAREGWGARFLDLQRADGSWGGGANFPEWTGTKPTLAVLRLLGPDPSDPRVRRAIDLVREHVRWEYDDPRALRVLRWAEAPMGRCRRKPISRGRDQLLARRARLRAPTRPSGRRCWSRARHPRPTRAATT